MLEYPAPLRGMASSLTTNIRLSATQAQRRLYQTEPLMLVLVSLTSSASRSSFREGIMHVKEMEISAISTHMRSGFCV